MVARQSHKLKVSGSSPLPATKLIVMENKTRYSVVYKNAETTSTWTYDLSKVRNVPVSVEIEYHDGLVERKLKKAKTEKPAKVVKPKPAKVVKPKPTKKAKAVKKAKPVKKKITKTVKKDKVNTNLGRFV